jgi:hypothetical protein
MAPRKQSIRFWTGKPPERPKNGEKSPENAQNTEKSADFHVLSLYAGRWVWSDAAFHGSGAIPDRTCSPALQWAFGREPGK